MNTYAILEVINSTYLYWIYVYTNETIIDEFHLVKVSILLLLLLLNFFLNLVFNVFIKDHNDVFERVFQERMNFLKYLETAKSELVVDNDEVTRAADDAHSSRLVNFIGVLLFLCSIIVGFLYVQNKFTKYLMRSNFDRQPPKAVIETQQQQQSGDQSTSAGTQHSDQSANFYDMTCQSEQTESDGWRERVATYIDRVPGVRRSLRSIRMKLGSLRAANSSDSSANPNNFKNYTTLIENDFDF